MPGRGVSPSEDMLLHDTPSWTSRYPHGRCGRAAALFPLSPSGWRFSLPLPLLEPRRPPVVVASRSYRPVARSRWPFAFGSPKGRPQLPSVSWRRGRRGARGVARVRDAPRRKIGDGRRGDLWGMEARMRGELALGAHDASKAHGALGKCLVPRAPPRPGCKLEGRGFCAGVSRLDAVAAMLRAPSPRCAGVRRLDVIAAMCAGRLARSPLPDAIAAALEPRPSFRDGYLPQR